MCELERHVRWGISALTLSLRRGSVFKDVRSRMPTTSVSYYEFTYVSVALIFWCFFFPQELYGIVAKESAGVGVSHVAFKYSL